jgi:hypothetical protein
MFYRRVYFHSAARLLPASLFSFDECILRWSFRAELLSALGSLLESLRDSDTVRLLCDVR